MAAEEISCVTPPRQCAGCRVGVPPPRPGHGSRRHSCGGTSWEIAQTPRHRPQLWRGETRSPARPGYTAITRRQHGTKGRALIKRSRPARPDLSPSRGTDAGKDMSAHCVTPRHRPPPRRGRAPIALGHPPRERRGAELALAGRRGACACRKPHPRLSAPVRSLGALE